MIRTATVAELAGVVRGAPAIASPETDLASYIRTCVTRDGAKPFITWYDDSTGERVELSYATFANWVWKTANYLRDGLDVQPGDEVAMLLPTHWQTVAIWYAAWAAGAVVSPTTAASLPASNAVAAFVAERDLAAVVEAGLPRLELIGLSLRPMAAKLAAGAPAEDYAVAVPVHGDQFVPGQRVSLTADAVTGRTGAQVLAGAAAAAKHLELSSTDRLLVTVDVTDPDVFIGTVGAAFDAGAGLVLCPHPDVTRLGRRCSDEMVTIAVDA